MSKIILQFYHPKLRKIFINKYGHIINSQKIMKSRKMINKKTHGRNQVAINNYGRESHKQLFYAKLIV